jgi:hypothetical protein
MMNCYVLTRSGRTARESWIRQLGRRQGSHPTAGAQLSPGEKEQIVVPCRVACRFRVCERVEKRRDEVKSLIWDTAQLFFYMLSRTCSRVAELMANPIKKWPGSTIAEPTGISDQTASATRSGIVSACQNANGSTPVCRSA